MLGYADALTGFFPKPSLNADKLESVSKPEQVVRRQQRFEKQAIAFNEHIADAEPVMEEKPGIYANFLIPTQTKIYTRPASTLALE